MLVWEPWDGQEPTGDDAGRWTSLADYLGPERHRCPSEAADVEVRVDVTTARAATADRERGRHLRQEPDLLRPRPDARPTSSCGSPQEGETVVALVSDRHDNIGMDGVARAIADAGGATAVFDAGDDTSTGQSLGGVQPRLA